ncbi:MAG TPA: hypothetical protein VIL95_01520 [Bacillota bacterium]
MPYITRSAVGPAAGGVDTPVNMQSARLQDEIARIVREEVRALLAQQLGQQAQPEPTMAAVGDGMASPNQQKPQGQPAQAALMAQAAQQQPQQQLGQAQQQLERLPQQQGFGRSLQQTAASPSGRGALRVRRLFQRAPIAGRQGQVAGAGQQPASPAIPTVPLGQPAAGAMVGQGMQPQADIQQLTQEMELNLRKLKQVIAETQALADRMESFLAGFSAGDRQGASGKKGATRR